MTSIYLAGSSGELPACEYWIAKLRKAGIEVTLDWPANIRAVGDANPREASEADRLRWTRADLDGVAAADIFWLLIPWKRSIGCWAELGAAQAWAREIIVSGDWRKTIFTSLADKRFDSHQEAFDWIVGDNL